MNPPVDDLFILRRLRELRQEISEIGALNRAYLELEKRQRSGVDKERHQQRRERLQEITEELAAMLPKRSAA